MIVVHVHCCGPVTVEQFLWKFKSAQGFRIAELAKLRLYTLPQNAVNFEKERVLIDSNWLLC
jgi:hypothetical protein